MLMLDLESHPPNAAVTKVSVEAVPAKPRTVQNGLFVPLSPEPEKLEVTLARIAHVVGKGKCRIAGGAGYASSGCVSREPIRFDEAGGCHSGVFPVSRIATVSSPTGSDGEVAQRCTVVDCVSGIFSGRSRQRAGRGNLPASGGNRITGHARNGMFG
jgi:hypothetical protein